MRRNRHQYALRGITAGQHEAEGGVRLDAGAEQFRALDRGRLDLQAAAVEYAETLSRVAGSPAILDLAHLGMGPDGHTASLVPDDPVLNVTNADVALTGMYMGRRRMTLTFPIINRSRRILWLITGSEKVPMFARLREADPTIPAGRISQTQALIMADRAATGQMDSR